MLNFHHFLKGLLMTDPQNPQAAQVDREDPNAPLEQIGPVEVTEVDEDGEQPPKEWGQQGEGSDEPQQGAQNAE